MRGGSGGGFPETLEEETESFREEKGENQSGPTGEHFNEVYAAARDEELREFEDGGEEAESGDQPEAAAERNEPVGDGGEDGEEQVKAEIADDVAKAMVLVEQVGPAARENVEVAHVGIRHQGEEDNQSGAGESEEHGSELIHAAHF